MKKKIGLEKLIDLFVQSYTVRGTTGIETQLSGFPKQSSFHYKWDDKRLSHYIPMLNLTADIANQLHNSRFEPQTQNPCGSWPLSSHHQSEWPWVTRDGCVVSVASLLSHEPQKQLQRPGGVKNKGRFCASEYLPNYIKCSLCCYIFIQSKLGKFRICSSKIITDD